MTSNSDWMQSDSDRMHTDHSFTQVAHNLLSYSFYLSSTNLLEKIIEEAERHSSKKQRSILMYLLFYLLEKANPPNSQGPETKTQATMVKDINVVSPFSKHAQRLPEPALSQDDRECQISKL
jgi:hypothetical protein